MSDKIDQIHKMLGALLSSSGHIHWVGGYAHGVTSTDDPYIVLYPASDKLDIKICRVYGSMYRKLPPIVNTSPNGNVISGKSTPTKKEAKDMGVYHQCARFKIVTCDGRMTQMGPERRFYDTLWYPNGVSSVQDDYVAVRRPYEAGGEVDRGNQAEIESYDLYVAEQKKRPFSRDNLREWYKRSK